MKRLLVAALAALFLAAGQAAPADAVELRVVAPAPGEAIFGSVEVRLEVSPAKAAAEIRRIEIFLDGRKVATLTAPPYRTVVEAGEANREHHLEAVAYGAAGPLASAELRALALRVDETIDVRLEQVYVTVERHGEPVPGLNKDDFEVYADGVKQEINTFERGEVPFTAVLLVDASTSMAGGRLQTALDGARSFFGAMAPFDEAKLMLFSDRLLVETPFTRLTAVLTLSLEGARAAGGTSLNDFLYLAAKRLEGRPGRKVIVLLSDGIDVDSVLGMDDLRAALGPTPGALLYWLRLKREEEARGELRISTSWRDPAGHHHEIDRLHRMVAASGGRIVAIDRVEQVTDTLATILRELRGQYVLGFNPPPNGADGKPPKIDVRMRQRGLDIRVHQGEHGR